MRFWWLVEDTLDILFESKVVAVAARLFMAGWLVWLLLTGYSIFMAIPPEHQGAALTLVTLTLAGASITFDRRK